MGCRTVDIIVFGGGSPETARKTKKKMNVRAITDDLSNDFMDVLEGRKLYRLNEGNRYSLEDPVMEKKVRRITTPSNENSNVM